MNSSKWTIDLLRRSTYTRVYNILMNWVWKSVFERQGNMSEEKKCHTDQVLKGDNNSCLCQWTQPLAQLTHTMFVTWSPCLSQRLLKYRQSLTILKNTQRESLKHEISYWLSESLHTSLSTRKTWKDRNTYAWTPNVFKKYQDQRYI